MKENQERLQLVVQNALAESWKMIPSQPPATLLHLDTEAGVSLGPVNAQLAASLAIRDGTVEHGPSAGSSWTAESAQPAGAKGRATLGADAEGRGR